ncbi:hypothetical protein WJX74_006990 [Apatococcus lobatus]|uniref:SF3 helicase domain-containing protein n=1 Tax=Apatococcus lobatus TaxID=904363 RepID=A0AAW1RA97_9CHLO
MNAHALVLQTLGYVPITAGLSYDVVAAKKRTTFCSKGWKRAINSNALEFCVDSDNALLIATGPSDVLVLDADVPKTEDVLDGIKLVTELIDRHGLPDNTPVQKSGSGGHHYFFSLSKSSASGLERVSNRTAVKYCGQTTTLDVRGDGGCIIVEPSHYNTPAGRREYRFQQPLCATEDLPSMPHWLIGILNSDQSQTTQRTVVAKRKLDSAAVVQDDFLSHVRPKIEAQLDNKMYRMYSRQGGGDFTVEDRNKVCTICGGIHQSNSYLCRKILDTCVFVRNYSKSCHMHIIDYRTHPVLSRILHDPSVDNPYVLLLQTRMSAAGHQLRVSGGEHTFYCFDGHHWAATVDISLQQELRLLGYEVIDTICRGLAGQLSRQPNQAETAADLKQFQKARGYIQKASNIRSITESAKQLLWDEELADKLDSNPDLLGVLNGVVELQNGSVRKGTPDDFISTFLDVEYVNGPTHDIHAFVSSLFNDDAHVVAYMQRLLGYAITGHTREQIWTIWTGSGSNGKSLLIGILQQLLGPLAVVMPREVIFDSGKRQTEGGPTPHLLPLIGKRLGIREEKQANAVLNDEVIKQMTGQSRITARGCHDKDYKTFLATHLPILVCNLIPPVDTDDAAMLRRFNIVPFNNIYTTPEDETRPYDPSNPHHRLKDNNLAAKLSTPALQQQLLTWLVEGAVQWYKSGLGEQPELLRQSRRRHIEENDKLSSFIQEHCTMAVDQHVTLTEFRQAYISDTGHTIKQEDLKKAMNNRNFPFAKIKRNGQTLRVYKGLSLDVEVA